MANFIEDLNIIFKHDPSIYNDLTGILTVVLTYPGFHALTFYRLANLLVQFNIPLLPNLISAFARSITGIEIHPRAKILGSIFIDHGHGVVIGPTTIIENNVVIYSGVVLGSRQGSLDKGSGSKRHPTIRNNVIIGAGAKILGNITIGNNAKIGANAVVLNDIPDNSTATGVPARLKKPVMPVKLLN